MRISDWSSDVCSSDLIDFDDVLAGRAGNDCEATTCARYPAVHDALVWLRRHAPQTRMSGTGASLFAAFPAGTDAETPAGPLPGGWQHFIARSEGRRAGKECVRTCRSRLWAYT